MTCCLYPKGLQRGGDGQRRHCVCRQRHCRSRLQDNRLRRNSGSNDGDEGSSRGGAARNGNRALPRPCQQDTLSDAYLLLNNMNILSRTDANSQNREMSFIRRDRQNIYQRDRGSFVPASIWGNHSGFGYDASYLRSIRVGNAHSKCDTIQFKYDDIHTQCVSSMATHFALAGWEMQGMAHDCMVWERIMPLLVMRCQTELAGRCKTAQPGKQLFTWSSM